MFIPFIACAMCTFQLEDFNHEIEKKISFIASKGEKLPTDPFEYGYIRGQLDAYMEMQDYLIMFQKK